MRVVSRSPSDTMMSMFAAIWSTVLRARLSLSGTSGKTAVWSLFFVTLAKPSTDVSGVRSSCETVAMKSVFIRSTSFSSVTSRTSTTDPTRSMVVPSPAWIGEATAAPIRSPGRAMSVFCTTSLFIDRSARSTRTSGRTSAASRPATSPSIKSMFESAGFAACTRPSAPIAVMPSAMLSRNARDCDSAERSSRVRMATSSSSRSLSRLIFAFASSRARVTFSRSPPR